MTTTIEKADEAARAIAQEHEIQLEQVIVYGSHASGDATEQSDIDLVLVSPDWEGVNYYERPTAFLIDWPRDELPTPDIIPVTPDELRKRAQSETDIVSTAVETGVLAG